MDIQNVSNNIFSPSAQKVTEVTQRVEGGDPKSSIGSLKPNQGDQSNVSPSLEVLKTKVDELNQALKASDQQITFGLDETTQSPVIQVKDRSTNELIRQLPSEDSLKMMQQIQEYLDRAQPTGSLNKESLTGNLFNEII
ncbi:flagellar protein FlaG [Thiomicrorhabdus indica]|uniref:flagellar protein FlaG n=1 Tax=Thiomicrorhabdus indica TaxID=2267253 RepID=UPI00102DD41E|nr:flagellar protein FlaG [Thiomicrorhabdus indica]